MSAPILYYVVPCYNEELVLRETAKRLKEKIADLIEKELISPESHILFVNDGSKDKTWDIITELHHDSLFSGVNLTRNKGHQNALLAGLMVAKEYADITISLDADLQDDINASEEMIKQYHNGYDIVYGVRSARDTDTFFKRFTAESFYKMMHIMGAETVFNHADYRLMSKKALACLDQFTEVNLFLRGIIPMIGYKTTTVTYERGERFAGESKYPLKKMLAFAIEGITSCSTRPLRFITLLGLAIFAISILFALYSIVAWMNGATIHGWASLMCSLWALGGLMLFALGIIGEYIGKIYLETKHRPRYFIKEVLH